jgi:L-seryl-tRNA(Ser) seleniumtransferase
LLLGNAELVERLRRFPLARALRVDKLTLAALEATLIGPPTPVATALASRPDDLLRRAERIAAALAEHGASAVRSTAAVGGGGAPGVALDSAAVALPSALAVPLRALDPAVVGHVERGRLLLDLIAVPADLDDVVVQAVRRVAKDG